MSVRCRLVGEIVLYYSKCELMTITEDIKAGYAANMGIAN